MNGGDGRATVALREHRRDRDRHPRSRISSVEAVEACLARIAEVNPRINAVVAFADDALDRARAADAPAGARRPDGPLHGVPFTIKDSIDTAGLVTTAGTVGWAERVPDRDATVVARLRRPAAILLGKTNTPEFTWSDETDNVVYGRTYNPYDLERTPGGSSGGPAAIVAAGGSPFDIGSDTGDSIRQPAHVCGIAGLKPTQRPRPADRPLAVVRGDRSSALHPARTDRPPRRRPRAPPADHRRPDGEDPHVPPVAAAATRRPSTSAACASSRSPTTASGRRRPRRSAPSGRPPRRCDAPAPGSRGVPPRPGRGRGRCGSA